MLRRLLYVPRIIAAEEQPSVDGRMQCLDPPIEHLREPRVLGDVFHRDPRLAQRRRSPARRKDFRTARRKATGEFDDTGLVGDGKQGATDFHVKGAL